WRWPSTSSRRAGYSLWDGSKAPCYSKPTRDFHWWRWTPPRRSKTGWARVEASRICNPAMSSSAGSNRLQGFRSRRKFTSSQGLWVIGGRRTGGARGVEVSHTYCHQGVGLLSQSTTEVRDGNGIAVDGRQPSVW